MVIDCIMDRSDLYRIDTHVVAFPIHSVDIVPAEDWRPEPEVLQWILDKWILDRGAQNPIKFDGRAWYLARTEFDLQTGRVTLTVGRGRYSHFKFTSLDPDFRRKFPPHQAFHALAIGALVRTADNAFYFARRPQNAQLSPGGLDIPCGHASDLDDAPSTIALPRAVTMVVERDMKCPITITGARSLIQLREQPKYADELIAEVEVEQTSEEISRAQPEGREVMFVPVEPDAVAAFIREYRAQDGLSRPTFPSLAYFGRKTWGMDWFQQFCLRPN